MDRTTQNLNRRRLESGFTLIELLVAIAILGILATITIQEVWQNIDEAKVTATRTKIKQVHQIVESYRRKHHNVPADLNELMTPDPMNYNRAWVEDPEAIYDAWDNLMVMKLGDRSGQFEIISYGANGAEDGYDLETYGLDTDLSSTRSDKSTQNQ